MKHFIVGGSVRDQLMGLSPRDRDHVIVGSSPEEMLALGYLPVGVSYPVFLHPQTREEYVLAPDLESDLKRRDLTINAMALDESGELFDPLGGRADLERKVLRHTSASFLDDPLRVYRVARFRAQLPDFTIAPETLTLMKELSRSESFRCLPGERIFSEIKKALEGERPSYFFETIGNINALNIHLPELLKLADWDQTMVMMEHAAVMNKDPTLTFAVLLHELGVGEVGPLCARLLVPNSWKLAAVVLTLHHLNVHRVFEMKGDAIVGLFCEMDAFRKPWLVDVLARGSGEDDKGRFLKECFEMVRGVGLQDIEEGLIGKQIGDAIRKERIRKLKAFLNSVNIPSP